MRGTPLFCLGILLAASNSLASDEPARIVRQFLPGTSTVVVVAEGQFEPRSVGSYSVMIYAGANPRFPYDDFIAGTVRSGNGAVAVEQVLFADVSGDGSPEIVAAIRSAGTGRYLSADALHLHGTTLSLVEISRRLGERCRPDSRA